MSGRIKFQKHHATSEKFDIREIAHTGFKSVVNSDLLRSRLKLIHLSEKQKFLQKYPHAVSFLKQNGVSLAKLREHSSKMLTSGALAGTLLLSLPDGSIYAQAPKLPPPIFSPLLAQETVRLENSIQYLTDELQSMLAGKPVPLAPALEKNIGLLIERLTGIKARATLEGEHLNTTYGYIGAEQHLPRFPGDTISQHDEFQASGITPGRGAWGYFVQSKAQLSEELIQKEKWYVAVQTLYLPDWELRLRYLRDWYKYRKVIVVDVLSGRAVVAVIADSGPAAWTGKHFGGSPEVMNALGGSKYKKGKVLLFFVDDPENKVPLGPVNYNELKLEGPVVEVS